MSAVTMSADRAALIEQYRQAILENREEELARDKLHQRYHVEKLPARKELDGEEPSKPFHPITVNAPALEEFLKRFDCTAVIFRKDDDITDQFDRTEPLGDKIVVADPNDPCVFRAACYGISSSACWLNKRLCILGITRVNREPLPELYGSYYYITLMAKDELGSVGTYQMQIFAGAFCHLKLLRPAPGDDTKAETTVPVTTACSVKRFKEYPDVDRKKPKLDIVEEKVGEEVQLKEIAV